MEFPRSTSAKGAASTAIKKRLSHRIWHLIKIDRETLHLDELMVSVTLIDTVGGGQGGQRRQQQLVWLYVRIRLKAGHKLTVVNNEAKTTQHQALSNVRMRAYV